MGERYPVAYVTYLIRNDSYLPGALTLAFAIREMQCPGDLVCLVTSDISASAQDLLGQLFDRVIQVPTIDTGHRDQHRQYLGHVLTKVNALRLGPDGDLGSEYEKVVVLDADLLPLRCFDHLFLVTAPAGVLNERKEHFKQTGQNRRYVCDPDLLRHGRWSWHDAYKDLAHGRPIPHQITDRVKKDPDNYGINTALMVLVPDMQEYNAIHADLTGEQTQHWMAQCRWPDMQYLSARWSGAWHNIDACFAGLSGYPSLNVLFGTHFAGPKPWQLDNRCVAERFSRFPDFQRWYSDFHRMMQTHPGFSDARRLRQIDQKAMVLGEAVRYA